MNQRLALVAIVVRNYDEAISFYVGTLGFDLVEDSWQPEQGKRWVVVRPKGEGGSACFWRKPRRLSRRTMSGGSRADASSCSWRRTISGATMMSCVNGRSNSCANRRPPITARSRCLGTSTAIYGTWCSLPPMPERARPERAGPETIMPGRTGAAAGNGRRTCRQPAAIRSVRTPWNGR